MPSHVRESLACPMEKAQSMFASGSRPQTPRVAACSAFQSDVRCYILKRSCERPSSGMTRCESCAEAAGLEPAAGWTRETEDRGTNEDGLDPSCSARVAKTIGRGHRMAEWQRFRKKRLFHSETSALPDCWDFSSNSTGSSVALRINVTLRRQAQAT